MSLWSASDAARATGGRAVGDWQVSGISIDTRSIEAGDLFVALTDQRDGHDFVAQALEKGAGAAMVSRIPEGVAPDAPLLVVPDVLAALGALGAAGRARFQGKLVGVTGSVGKTSTKEMLRSVLARQGKVHAAEKSFNNHWGVPITLARMPADADFAIVEIGMNHPGEIAPLAEMAQPHVALITTIAPAHMEAFDGIDGIAREKATIFQGLVAGGVAVIPSDLNTSAILRDGADAAPVLTFGEAEESDFTLLTVNLVGDTTVVKAALPEGDILFKIDSAGRHFAMNAMGVLATVAALQADTTLAARDMMLWQPPAGRGARMMLCLDPVEVQNTLELIDDSYNANPTSMAAALEVLAASDPQNGLGRIRRGRRIAILGDMLELGPTQKADHRALAGLESLNAVDVVHAVGPLMRLLWQALPDQQRGIWRATSAELAAELHQLIDAGDVVMVKGSLGAKVGLVVDALKKLSHPAPTKTGDTAADSPRATCAVAHKG